MPTPANPRPRWLASDEALERIAAIAAAPLRRGHHVRVLRDGGLAFPAMLALIRVARRAVCFENFIFAGDATGEEFARGLERAHARGVAVRVLYDPIGTMLVRGGSIRRRLAASALAVRAFRPLSMVAPWSWFRLRHRDHRKVLIADDLGAVVGGLCIADHWAPAERGGSGWRDTALLVRGPAVADLQLAFERMWRRAVDLMPETLWPTRTEWPSVNLPRERGEAAVIVVGDRPRTQRVAALYEWLAARAEATMDISDAYPIVTPQVLRALIAAARRGVRLRFLVPGRTNHPLAGLAARRIYDTLLEAGAEIYEWSGVMLHAKTAVVDGVISLVGSSNLDPLSLRRNYELNLVVGCPRTGAAMEDLFSADIADAHRLTLEEWRARPPLFKLGEALATLFAWNL